MGVGKGVYLLYGRSIPHHRGGANDTVTGESWTQHATFHWPQQGE